MTADIALPRVLADLPLAPTIAAALQNHVELLPWNSTDREKIQAIYTYGHPLVDARLLEKLPQVRVISNFGVGVDHIDVRPHRPAASRSATRPASWTAPRPTWRSRFCWRPAAGWSRATAMPAVRSSLHYDPSYMLGREVHGSTLGIIGMGRIGDAGGPPGARLRHDRPVPQSPSAARRRRPASGLGIVVRRIARGGGLRGADRAADAGDAWLDRPGGVGAHEAGPPS